MTPTALRAWLKDHADGCYADFQRKLIPEYDPSRIIGVSIPKLRALSREITDLDAFLDSLPHAYLEEDLLHGILIAGIPDYGACRARIEAFLPYIDNWAVCDLPTPGILSARPDETLVWIDVLLNDPRPYFVRYGILLLMRLYLPILDPAGAMRRVSAVSREEHCIVKAAGWFFATALTLHADLAREYFMPHRLSPAIYKSAWQKARESRAIDRALLHEIKACADPECR